MSSKTQKLLKIRCWAILAVFILFLTNILMAGAQEKKFFSGSPFTFDIGLKSGWSAWAMKDLSISKESIEKLAEIWDYNTTTQDLVGSMLAGLDLALQYHLPNSHKLGLSTGLQYFPGGIFQQDWGDTNISFKTKLELSAFVIPLELYYLFPAGKNLDFKFAGGIDFYSATADYNFSVNGTEYVYGGKLKDSGIGGHVSLGAEYQLNRNLALTLEAGYSIAQLDNFTGTLKDNKGNSTEKQLIMVQEDWGEILDTFYTTEPLPTGTRPANLDFNGFKVSVGLRYTFSKKRDEETSKCISRSGQHHKATFDPGNFGSLLLTVQSTPTPNQPQPYESTAFVGEFTTGKLTLIYTDPVEGVTEVSEEIQINNLSKKIFSQGIEVSRIEEIFSSISLPGNLKEATLLMFFNYPILIELCNFTLTSSPDGVLEFVTDKNRDVKTFDDGEPTEGDLDENTANTVLRILGLYDKFTQVAGPTDSYNCFGWLFTCGRKWLLDFELKNIMADNGYKELKNSPPEVGDIVIYWNVYERHGGLVREVDKNGKVTKIESKFGRWGRYLHAPEDVPPDLGSPRYYRTTREKDKKGKKERHTLKEKKKGKKA